MRVPILRVCVMAFAIGATLIPGRASASAPASTCPQIWSFSRVGQENLYALTLRANVPTTTDVTIKLRAGIDPYIATVPAVAIDQQTKAALVPYRSSVILLPEPADEKVTDVVVDFQGTSGACPSEARSTAPPHRVFPPSDASRPTGVYQDLREALDAEALRATPISMRADPDPLPLCAEKDAKTTRAVPPEYPSIAKQMGAQGTASIIIDLDSAGNIVRADVYHTSGNATLDEAARLSALRSTYESGSVACIATASTYLFRATFSQQ